MKLMSLILLATVLWAVDIHNHGVVIPFTPLPDDNQTVISFSNGIVFDTRKGEPMFPKDLSISQYEGNGYYLVQVNGPVYSEWIDELDKSGIEVVGYIPNYTLIVHASDEELRFIKTRSFVYWTGIYQPAYKLQRDLIDTEGTGRVTIQLFPEDDIQYIATQIQQNGFTVIETIDHALAKTIDAHGDLSHIHKIAKIPGVLWIQLWSEPRFFNENCQWVTQTGWQSSVPSDPWARRVWYEGVVGNGVILSTTDSGITTGHDQFYDSSNPISAPGVFPNHRKIVAYKLYRTAAFGDNAINGYHGTHVNCTAAGNDTLNGISTYDGMAKEAKIYFLDIANASGGLTIVSNLTTLYDSIYPGHGLPYNIVQHSGSWGWDNFSGTYLTQDATTDAYLWAHKDFLNLYSAGNSGAGGKTIGNPALAKNVLTIGGTQNGTLSNQIYYYSSRGYTQDRRIKPNVLAPGQSLYSADGATTSGYKYGSGTSMAAPAANGSIALIRQYLLMGFYPSGAENPADSIKYQSAALLRAMAIVSCDPNIGSWTPPDSNIGWGRIDVDSVLYFSGDMRKLMIKDDTIGMGTGQSIVDSFFVNSDIPLRICVAWTDTAAAPGANPTLVNDLNVTLRAPSGTFYHGNIYSGGVSSPNPPNWDDRNVEECFRINNPELGRWDLTVSGQNVPYGPQPYAYAITGNISLVPGIEEGNTTVPETNRISFNSITTGKIIFKIILSSPTNVEVRIFDLTGRFVETIISSELPAGETVFEHNSNLPNGIYFIEVNAGAMDRQVGKMLIVN